MWVDKGFLQRGFHQFIQVARGEADWIPITAQLPEHARRLCRLSPSDFYSRPLPFVKAMLAVHQYYRLDAVYLFYDVYNIEAEAMGQRLLYPSEDMPVIDQGSPLIREKADLDRIRWPLIGKSGRMPFVLELCRLFIEYTDLPAIIGICAPFSLAVGIRSYPALARDLYHDPPFVHELLRRLTLDLLVPWAETIKSSCSGRVVIFAADAWASPPNISLEVHEEFVLPYNKLLYDQTGVPPLGQWGQSYVREPERFVDNQLAMGMPGVIALDPDLGRLGIGWFKALSDKKGVPLTIGIDAQGLYQGPAERLRGVVEEYLRVGAPGGRTLFFLNYIPPATPVSHVMTVVETVRRFGRYRAEVNCGDRIPNPLLSFDRFLEGMGIRDQGEWFNRL